MVDCGKNTLAWQLCICIAEDCMLHEAVCMLGVWDFMFDMFLSYHDADNIPGLAYSLQDILTYSFSFVIFDLMHFTYL